MSISSGMVKFGLSENRLKNLMIEFYIIVPCLSSAKPDLRKPDPSWSSILLTETMTKAAIYIIFVLFYQRHQKSELLTCQRVGGMVIVRVDRSFLGLVVQEIL